VGFIIAAAAGSPYQDWDYNDPELAAAGAILHGMEFVFVRVAPFVLIGSIVGIVLTCKRKR
jgi:putative transcriptional regulator